jgi:hypothetical protein
MNFKHDRQQPRSTATVQRLFAAALVLACIVSGTTAHAAAQQLTPPATPTLITPPVGNSAFLVGHAEGTQGYVCLPTAPGAATASWTINAARPEATLFQSFYGNDFQIVTHFLSPNTNPNGVAPRPIAFGNATWQSSFDSSKVWAQVLHGNVVTAGTDLASCPNTGSIACLLLEAIGAEQGPTGGNLLSQTTFIQRLNTKGGSAPADGCFTSSDVGKQTLVPYTADYVFFRKAKQQ